MPGWEYKYIYEKSNTNDKNIEKMLNKLGNDRWELVGVVSGTGANPDMAKVHSYIFKRPK